MNSQILSRAAAGARLESRDGDAVARLYAAWPLIAEAHAPGTLIQQALVDVDEAGGLAAAQRQLGERLHASRAAPACSLPAEGPLVARYVRTGEPSEGEQADPADGGHRRLRMNTLCLEILLYEYWHAGTGRGSGPVVDAEAARTPAGLPYLPGRTVRGLLREGVQQAEESGLPEGRALRAAWWCLSVAKAEPRCCGQLPMPPSPPPAPRRPNRRVGTESTWGTA